MKHIKLFESFTTSGSGMNPVLISKGDWSEILLDPTNENISLNALFIHPSTFIVDYITNPKPGEAQNDIGYTYDDVENIVENIVGGDQNGHVLAPKNYATPSYTKGSQGDMDEKNGIVRMNVDPSIDPEEIKSALQVALDSINDSPSDYEGPELEEILSDPRASSIYTPEFIEHAKEVAKGRFNPGTMRRKLVFNII